MPIENFDRSTLLIQPIDDKPRDRFVDQMMFVPENYDEILKRKKYKTILSIDGLPERWNVSMNTDLFSNLNCPVQTCRLTTKPEERSKADMVIFMLEYKPTNETMPNNQITAVYYPHSYRATQQQKAENISKPIIL